MHQPSSSAVLARNSTSTALAKRGTPIWLSLKTRPTWEVNLHGVSWGSRFFTHSHELHTCTGCSNAFDHLAASHVFLNAIVCPTNQHILPKVLVAFAPQISSESSVVWTQFLEIDLHTRSVLTNRSHLDFAPSMSN